MKPARLVLLVVAVALLLTTGGFWLSRLRPAAPNPQTTETTPAIRLPTRMITIKDTTFTVYLARSADERQRGLSGTKTLAMRYGMLFYNPARSVHGLWMKDMSLALDALWVNDRGRIVHIEENITPETYPRTFNNPAETPAVYFVELNAGDVARYNLRIGDTVTVSRPLDQ